MNKLLIVLLAVCLVSVHAFVKRDTTTDLSGVAKDIQDKLQEFGKKLESSFDPEKVKKDVTEFIDQIGKAIKTDKPAA